MESHAPHEEVAGDVIMGVLQRCGIAAVGTIGGSTSSTGGFPSSSSSAASCVVDGALSVVLGGQWPPAASQRQPRSFEDVFEALGRSPEPAVNAASRDPLHQVCEIGTMVHQV